MEVQNGCVPQLERKRLAAHYAVDHYVQSGQAIGVGTGRTATFVIEYLAEKRKNGEINNLTFVPTSLQTRHVLIENGFRVSDLERTSVLDLAIEGVDEIDPHLNCIKGCGGCLTREKVVLRCARRVIIAGDNDKRSDCLGDKFECIPLEVVPFACAPVKNFVQSTEGGRCVLRMAQMKAGPVITDNGNYVIDWYFPTEGRHQWDWRMLHHRLKLVTGLVETGLFVNLAERAIFGMDDGTVEEMLKPDIVI